jgi:hypothetical protein
MTEVRSERRAAEAEAPQGRSRRILMPGLIVDTLAPIGGAPEDRAAMREAFRALWQGLDRLGMTAELLEGVPVELPELPDDEQPGFRLLAGRARPDTEATYEAFAFTLHDVVGVRVALASNLPEEGVEAWSGRLDEWRSVDGGPLPGAFLGGSLLFLGLDSEGDGFPEETTEEVRRGLRGCGLDCWDAYAESLEDVAVWEGPGSEGRRVLAAAAPLDRQADLDRWVWWRGPHELASFARYLMHAGKLHYESRVFERRRASMKATLANVDSALGSVLDLHRGVRVAGAATLPALLDAQSELTRARVEQTGLAVEISNLRQLRRTVTIAERNLRALGPPPDPDAPEFGGTLVGRDLALAAWLGEQIEHDIGYAEAVSERADHVHAMTSLQLEAASRRIDRARARMDLIQTALLGAVVSGVLAYGTLGITFRPDHNVRLPLLASLASLLLAVPILIAHWHEPFRALDHTVGALFGASAGWLLSVVVWPGFDAPAIVVIVAALAASGLALLTTRAHDRGANRSGTGGLLP